MNVETYLQERLGAVFLSGSSSESMARFFFADGTGIGADSTSSALGRRGNKTCLYKVVSYSKPMIWRRRLFDARMEAPADKSKLNCIRLQNKKKYKKQQSENRKIKKYL